MKTIKTLAIAFVAVLVAASAYAADTRGKLVDVTHEGSVVVKTDVLGLAGAEARNIKFDVADDAAYVICLAGHCAEKRGAEGVKLFGEYTAFEAYGLSPIGASVTLKTEGALVIRIQANL